MSPLQKPSRVERIIKPLLMCGPGKKVSRGLTGNQQGKPRSLGFLPGCECPVGYVNQLPIVGSSTGSAGNLAVNAARRPFDLLESGFRIGVERIGAPLADSRAKPEKRLAAGQSMLPHPA